MIDGLEDGEDYRDFEAAIIADYEPETAIERELVLRLASCCGGCVGSSPSRPICLQSRVKSCTTVAGKLRSRMANLQIKPKMP